MQIKTNQKHIVTSQSFQEVGCTINAEDVPYIASLLRNNYSDPSWASVREIVANAVDASKENGGRIPVVCLPNKFSLEFSVRDYGAGLSEEDIFGLYSKYGKSTKRNDNAGIGGFGIGRFAPLAYGEIFTVQSFVDGHCTIYSVRVDERDDTKITKMSGCQTPEPNGVKISMPVKAGDCEKFKAVVKRLSFFGVQFKCVDIPTAKKWEEIAPTVLSGKDWRLVQMREVSTSLGYSQGYYSYNGYSQGYYSYNYTPSHFVSMGGIPYPLDFSNIETSNSTDFIQNMSKHSLVLSLPIGSVSLHHSRESLKYTDATKEVLKNALSKFLDEVKSEAQRKIDSCKKFTDAVSLYNDFYSISKNRVDVGLTWKNRPIESVWSGCDIDGSFLKRYVRHEENVSGYRCSGMRCTASHGKNKAILFDDMPENKVKFIVRKVNYLLDKKDINEVYVIGFKCSDKDLKKIKKDCFFDELEKEGLFANLSTAKQKTLPKTVRDKRKVSLRGVMRLRHSPSWSIHYNWQKSVNESDIPAGKKYYLPTSSGYVRTLSNGMLNPKETSYAHVIKALGLKDGDPIFGLTPDATKRLSKNSDWIDIRLLIEEKLTKAVKDNSSSFSLEYDLEDGQVKKFFKKFGLQSDLPLEVTKAFELALDGLSEERKSRKAWREKHLSLLKLRSIVKDDAFLNTKGEKSQKEIDFLTLSEKYFPWVGLERYSSNELYSLTKLSDAIGYVYGGVKMKRVARIAKAIHLAEPDASDLCKKIIDKYQK